MWRASFDAFVGFLAIIVIGALIVLGPVMLMLIGLLLPVFLPLLVGLFVGMVFWEAIKQAARSVWRWPT